MSAQFWPCPGCSRHVKRGDAICPFCGATASVDIGPTRALSGRLSRAAIFAAGATIACGGEVNRRDAGASDAGASYVEASAEAEPDVSMVATEPPYGVPPVEDGDTISNVSDDASPDASDAGTTGQTDSSSAPDVLNVAVPYGLPPRHP
jgi:hypothetical protein